MILNPPEPIYKKGDELTVLFHFTSGKTEVNAIGKVQSIRWIVESQKWLYQLEGCDTPDGLYVAWQDELTPTTPEDKVQLEAQA